MIVKLEDPAGMIQRVELGKGPMWTASIRDPSTNSDISLGFFRSENDALSAHLRALKALAQNRLGDFLQCQRTASTGPPPRKKRKYRRSKESKAAKWRRERREGTIRLQAKLKQKRMEVLRKSPKRLPFSPTLRPVKREIYDSPYFHVKQEYEPVKIEPVEPEVPMAPPPLEPTDEVPTTGRLARGWSHVFKAAADQISDLLRDRDDAWDRVDNLNALLQQARERANQLDNELGSLEMGDSQTPDAQMS